MSALLGGARWALLFLPAAVVLAWLLSTNPKAPSVPDVSAKYARPLAPPDAPLRVFHLGHSLVGRDMPAMLAQLAGSGHSYNSQLGWGTPLKAHWETSEPINGFAAENAHDRYRDAHEAAESGGYDAFIVTEMVEIRDAVRYHQSEKYLSLWAGAAQSANRGTVVYLFETWHRTNDPDGWLERIDADLERHWKQEILYPAVAEGPAIYLIPGGQVMAAFARELEIRGGVGNIRDHHDLFAYDAAGARDTIHLNDFGSYLMALTHYAVLYHKNPAGLPNALYRADGSLALAPSPEAARVMQDVVWQVVSDHPMTGVSVQPGS